MTSLKAEPAGRIRSMGEFFAMARAMELDAASRYTEIARQLALQGETALAEVFTGLAETERGHVGEVDQWADRTGTQEDATLPWPIPDTFDAPPDEVARSNLLTPYLALASAVRHEERSFAFWAYVAANTDNEEVRVASERMAHDELEHMSLLRRERRKAYHTSQPDRTAGDSQVTLAALAASERRLADLLMRQPDGGTDAPAAATSLAEAARASAARLEAVSANHTILVPELPASRTDDIPSLCEYLAEAYLRLAESSSQDDLLGLAQELGDTAIRRLAFIASEPATEK